MSGEIVNVTPATPMQILHLFKSELGNGRGGWKIFWTDDGDMIFGCYPFGDTYLSILDAPDIPINQFINEDLID